MTDVWELEFPRLYKLRNPKTFLADLLIGIESKLRKLVFIGVILVMAYVIYYRFSQYYKTGDMSIFETFPPKDDWALWTWIGYRNFFYLIMLFDLVLAVPVMMIYVLRKNYPKLIKVFYGWFLLLFFITFSYAIAGIFIDAGIFLIAMNWNILYQTGAPVGDPPFGMTFN